MKAEQHQERPHHPSMRRSRINGVSILPKEKTIEMGRRIVEFRANDAVAAIRKAIPGGGTSESDEEDPPEEG